MFWAEILGGFLPPEDEKSRCPVANVNLIFFSALLDIYNTMLHKS